MFRYTELFEKKKITFTHQAGKEGNKFLEPPLSAKKVVPKWYKTLIPFMEGRVNQPTTKKCIPFLDALSMGYVIKTDFDILLSKDQKDCKWTMSAKMHPLASAEINKKDIHVGVIEHIAGQYPPEGFQDDEIHLVLKFLNPWIINTPPGYSCLCINPCNHLRPDFRILEGVVDTDEYKLPIAFPFIPKKFEGEQKIIKKDSPIAMIIPFKRESWKATYKEIEPKEVGGDRINFFKRIVDNYKKNVWHRKNFD